MVIGAEDVARPKPDAEPFRIAFERMGGETPPVLMVGDTSADILGARNAGIVGVAALWGTRDRDALLALSPEHVASQPLDVLALVDSANAHTGRP